MDRRQRRRRHCRYHQSRAGAARRACLCRTAGSGAALDQGDEAGVVESVKAASEVYTPCSGEIVEANEELADAPTTVNDHPEGDGWLFKIKLSDTKELDEFMNETEYQEFLKELDE